MAQYDRFVAELWDGVATRALGEQRRLADGRDEQTAVQMQMRNPRVAGV